MASESSSSQVRLLQARVAELEAENQRLRQSESRYRQIFENAPISMVLCNRDGYLTEINAAAEDFYGLPIAQFNQQVAPIFDNPQLVENGTLPYMQRVLAGEAVIEAPTYYDASRNSLGGSFSNGRGHYAPIRNGAGVVVEFVEICPDYADFFALQAQLLAEQEQAAQERARLLSTVARVANLLLRSPDYTAVLPEVVRLLGEAVGSDRCAIVTSRAYPVLPNLPIYGAAEWCNESILSSYHCVPELDSIAWENFPELYEKLLQQQTANYLTKDLVQSGRDIFEAQGVSSIVYLPISVNGQPWGQIGFDNCGEPRLYDEAEIAVLKVAADSIAAAIERQAQDYALRESEHRYRTLFELSNEGIYRFEFDEPISTDLPIEERLALGYRGNRITEVNSAFVEQYGFDSAEAIVGFRLNDFYADEYSQQADQGNRSLMRDFRVRDMETVETDRLGRHRWFLSNVVCDVRNGYIFGGWGTQTDITELKQTQQALLAAEQDRTQRLQTIASLANQLLRTNDYTAVLPHVLQVLGETAGSDRCSLVQNVINPATGQLAIKMHTEWCREGIVTSVEHTPELASALLWDWVADFQPRLARGETLSFAVDELAEPVRSLFRGQGNVTMLMVPITVRGEFWGVFGFDYCQEARLLDEADQAVFAIAADSIAAAIERDLNQQEREQMAQQRVIDLAQVNDVLKASLNRLASEPDLDAFLGHVVHTINQAVGAASGHVFLHNAVTNTLELRLSVDQGTVHIGPTEDEPTLFHSPFPADITPAYPQSCETGEIALFSLIENSPLSWPGNTEWHRRIGHREAAAVALMAGDHLVGMLGLSFTESIDLTTENKELIRALADQASLAIQLAQLAETTKQIAVLEERDCASQQRAAELEEHNRVLQRRDRILEATATAANTLLTTNSLDDAVNTALQIIGENLDTDRVAIAENEPYENAANLSLVKWQLLYEWNSSHTFSQLLSSDLSQGNYAGVETWPERLANGESIGYLLEELPEPFRSAMAKVDVKAIYEVPIFVEGQCWGAFVIDDCREAKHRNPAELAVLKTAAACIGSAIQRDRTQKAILAAEQARTQELAQLNAELQHTLDRLSESETRFRELFENSNDGIYFCTFDEPVPLTLSLEEQIDLAYRSFRFIDANPAHARMFGATQPEEVIGKRLHDLHDPQSNHRELMRKALGSGWNISNLESDDVDEQGRKRYFLSHLFTTIDDGHAVRGWGIINDITDLRQAQDALAEERLQAETALIRERTRIAQEIHDTLAQTFTGITVQLELAQYLIAQAEAQTSSAPSTPADLPAILEGVSTLAQTGLEAARRSVWAIYPATGAYGTLPQELAASLEQLTAPLELQTQFTVTGEPQPLSYLVGQNLLRVGQEAITNVLKHAQANTLWVELAYTPDTVSLRVKDDGCGFSPQAQTEGFGLVGMSERVESLHGRLSILSQPHQGAEIFVQVPL